MKISKKEAAKEALVLKEALKLQNEQNEIRFTSLCSIVKDVFGLRDMQQFREKVNYFADKYGIVENDKEMVPNTYTLPKGLIIAINNTSISLFDLY